MPTAIRDLRGRPEGPEPPEIVKRFLWFLPLRDAQARSPCGCAACGRADGPPAPADAPGLAVPVVRRALAVPAGPRVAADDVATSGHPPAA